MATPGNFDLLEIKKQQINRLITSWICKDGPPDPFRLFIAQEWKGTLRGFIDDVMKPLPEEFSRHLGKELQAEVEAEVKAELQAKLRAMDFLNKKKLYTTPIHPTSGSQKMKFVSSRVSRYNEFRILELSGKIAAFEEHIANLEKAKIKAEQSGIEVSEFDKQISILSNKIKECRQIISNIKRA